MDGKRTLEVSEWCANNDRCVGCTSPKGTCYLDEVVFKPEDGTTEHAKRILEVRDHVKAEERANERAEVIGKVREWIELFTSWDGAKDFVLPKAITDMLDELEQEGK